MVYAYETKLKIATNAVTLRSRRRVFVDDNDTVLIVFCEHMIKSQWEIGIKKCRQHVVQVAHCNSCLFCYDVCALCSVHSATTKKSFFEMMYSYRNLMKTSERTCAVQFFLSLYTHSMCVSWCTIHNTKARHTSHITYPLKYPKWFPFLIFN